MESATRFTIDAAHCRRAADELYLILRDQERAFVARVYRAFARRKVLAIARGIGLSASLFGLALVCLLRYFDTRSWSTQPTLWFIPLFLVFTATFVFAGRVSTSLEQWSFRSADGRARRNADRGLRKAQRLAPYEAAYDLKGDLLTYSRNEDGEWRHAWARNLGKFRASGSAVQADSITVIFRRPSSLVPAVLILQNGRAWTDEVLTSVGLTVIRTPTGAASPTVNSAAAGSATNP